MLTYRVTGPLSTIEIVGNNVGLDIDSVHECDDGNVIADISIDADEIDEFKRLCEQENLTYESLE